MTTDFNSVLHAALNLPPQEQMRLIDALWASAPVDADAPLHEDWGPELEQRIAAAAEGSDTAVTWAAVREAALARIGHGSAD